MNVKEAREITNRYEAETQYPNPRDNRYYIAQGYLKRDTQLRPLIEGLVESVEVLTKFSNWEEWSDENIKIIEEALTLAHKAGFGKEKI